MANQKLIHLDQIMVLNFNIGMVNNNSNFCIENRCFFALHYLSDYNLTCIKRV